MRCAACKLAACFLIGGMLLPATVGGAETEAREIFRQYEGRWTGKFTIRSSATGYSETFPVEQQYWMRDGELRGLEVAERKDGMATASSRTFVKEGRLYSEVERSDGETERFIGTVHEGGIVWIPADLRRARDYQIREMFREDDGQRLLLTEGFDTYRYQGEKVYLIYRGRLSYAGEGRAEE